MTGKGKKIAAAVILVVLILAVAAPIPIPVRKTMTGMAWTGTDTAQAETAQLEVNGIYWFRLFGDNRYSGMLKVSTETDTADAAGNGCKVEFVHQKKVPSALFYLGGASSEYFRPKHVRYASVSGIFRSVLLSSDLGDEEDIWYFAAPAASEKEAEDVKAQLVFDA